MVQLGMCKSQEKNADSKFLSVNWCLIIMCCCFTHAKKKKEKGKFLHDRALGGDALELVNHTIERLCKNLSFFPLY